MMLGFLSERGGNAANLISDGGGHFCLFFHQIGAMVLLISSKQINLESCACAQNEVHEEGKRRLYLDDAGGSSKRGRNASNLISDGSGLFSFFSSNWCPGSANIS